ncbi:MAG: hypothetical protein ACJ8GW_17750 [Massilia sp.]
MMNDERDPVLDAPVMALRKAMATLESPPGVEKELLAAFAQHFPRRRWYQVLSPAQWGMGSGLAALGLVLAVSLHPERAPGPATVLAGLDRGAFIALESAERIEEESEPHMLETEVPRTALAALGVPVSPENAGDSVRAELLVGADGSPLALRLIALQ